MWKSTARRILRNERKIADAQLEIFAEERARLGKFAVHHEAIAYGLVGAALVASYPYSVGRSSTLYGIANNLYYMARQLGGVSEADVVAELSLYRNVPSAWLGYGLEYEKRAEFLALVLDSPDEFRPYFEVGFTDVKIIADLVAADVDPQLALNL